MPWFKYEMPYPGIFSISEPFSLVDPRFSLNTVNCYLVIGTTSAALIDTGMGIGDLHQFIRKLTALPIQVLNTHYHWDHVGGNHQFNQCAIHHLEAELLNKTPSLDYSLLRKSLSQLKKRQQLPDYTDPDRYKIYPYEAKTLLNDNDVISLGHRNLHAIHTPGHSPGHLCFLDDQTGCLFTGDTAYMGPIYSCFSLADPEAYYKSCQRLNRLKTVQAICPGHNQIIKEPKWLHTLAQFAERAVTGQIQGINNQGYVQSKVYQNTQAGFSINLPL
ncbi:MBL fold metallo-hydrolase [Piscirickettsia litoralis]|uniref:Metallo-beta-lactamase domain-containing protein n=1 Tax=Piscirickettsia litoralis TaxID=1891921 RepID=A0ABX3A335_9GAMM|nr:MBL fold metallo-hydrolase [Piscirickettsia litoralis]ODN43277.1 hypothetical protein BGC07_10550 [Piscirickettsia litoralis]